MSSITTELLLIGLLLVLNGLLAMAEIAIVSARKSRLRQQADAGDAGAAAALELAEQPTRFLSTVQIGITLVGILAGAFGGATIAAALGHAIGTVPALAAYAEAIGLALVVAAITFLSLIVGELVPKRLALNAPERIATLVARPMRLVATLVSPVVSLLTLTTDGLLRALGVGPPTDAAITEEEVRVLIAQGTEAGVFEVAERELVESTFELSEAEVRELMTPRVLVDWLDLEDEPEEQWQSLAAMPHMHVPLCRGQLDEVVGILVVREVVPHLVAGRRPDLVKLAHPPVYLPQHLRALNALEQLRQARPHVALVIDEHGSIAGLLTPTDLREALVGDLAPGPGEATNGPVRRADGSWLVDGLIPVDEAAELFGLPEPRPGEQERVQTLGGVAMARLGRVPTAGDRVTWRGLRLEVVDMDGRRVDKLLVTPGSSTEGARPRNEPASDRAFGTRGDRGDEPPQRVQSSPR
jgi:putative hemolysin